MITTGQASDTDTMQVLNLIDGSVPEAGVNDTKKDSGLLSNEGFEETEAIDKGFEARGKERTKDKHNKNAEAQTAGANMLELSMGDSEQFSDQKSAIEKSLTNTNGKHGNSSVDLMESEVKAFSFPNLFIGGLANTAKGQGHWSKALSLGSSLQSSLDSSSQSSKSLSSESSLQCSSHSSFQSRQGSQASTISLKNYPQDSYSFLSLHGPFDQPIFFGMGILVCFFQLMLLVLMLLSVIFPQFGTLRYLDRDEADILSRIAAANANKVVQATQVIATLAYVLFADASVLDLITAIEQFPKFSKVANDDKVGCMVFSCMLRFLQGFLAMVTAVLLIITSGTVVEIVLNFSAVNFISSLDNVAFQLAFNGKYSEKLEQEAKRITKLQLPPCMSQQFRFTLASLVLIFLTISGGIISAQAAPWIWRRTTTFMLDFSTAELQAYSGCYKTAISLSRIREPDVYFLEDGNTILTILKYCIDDLHWSLSTNSTHACHPEAKDDELAKSSTIDTGDIRTAFDEPWYSASGTPIVLDAVGWSQDDEEYCYMIDDGNCNNELNVWALGYDSGDCCSATCSHPACGIGGITNAFGVSTNITGNGFPNCKDPNMIAITIQLGSFTESERDPLFYEEGNSVDNPYLIVECEGKIVLSLDISKDMANGTNIVHVADGANCALTVQNQTGRTKTIWHLDYSIYVGEIAADSSKLLQGNSGQEKRVEFKTIPYCIIEKLSTTRADIFEWYNDFNAKQALYWIVDDNSGNSDCRDDYFIERFGLSVLNFSAPVKGNGRSWINSNPTCLWSATTCKDLAPTELDLNQLELSGTIPKFIYFLQSFSRLNFGNNIFTGTIPSEFGLMTALEHLELHSNDLSGSIPSEIQSLTGMQYLDLSNNDLTGRIPSEIWSMPRLRGLYLDRNQLIGSIPSEIGLLTDWNNLVLYSNQLNGNIPSEIGLLTSLNYLYLNENQLTGSIPSEIGLLTGLEFLDLSSNQLTGSIPSEIGLLTGLEFLDLSSNQLIGSIPSEIGLLTSLNYLYLNENQLTGISPPEIKNLLLLDIESIDFLFGQNDRAFPMSNSEQTSFPV